jgi:hypothetical protein
MPRAEQTPGRTAGAGRARVLPRIVPPSPGWFAESDDPNDSTEEQDAAVLAAFWDSRHEEESTNSADASGVTAGEVEVVDVAALRNDPNLAKLQAANDVPSRRDEPDGSGHPDSQYEDEGSVSPASVDEGCDSSEEADVVKAEVRRRSGTSNASAVFSGNRPDRGHTNAVTVSRRERRRRKKEQRKARARG